MICSRNKLGSELKILKRTLSKNGYLSYSKNDFVLKCALYFLEYHGLVIFL